MNDIIFPFRVVFAEDMAIVLDITPLRGEAEGGLIMMASGDCYCAGPTVETSEGLRMQVRTKVGEAAMALFGWKAPIVVFAPEAPVCTFLVGEEYRFS
jgi:hypothetical protein